MSTNTYPISEGISITKYRLSYDRRMPRGKETCLLAVFHRTSDEFTKTESLSLRQLMARSRGNSHRVLVSGLSRVRLYDLLSKHAVSITES